MAGIARRAGVAAQTVYFVFHTKAELISAVVDAQVVGEDEPRPPEAQQWWADMLAEPDAAESLRVFVRGAAPIFARAAPIAVVLRAAALTDEEVRRTHEHHENLQKAAFRQVLEGLRSKARLRQGQSLDQLTDAFTALYGDSMYDLLVRERGWRHEQFVDWMCDLVPRVLLDDQQPSGNATPMSSTGT